MPKPTMPRIASRACLAVAVCGLLALGGGPASQGHAAEKAAEGKPATEKKEEAQAGGKEGAKGENGSTSPTASRWKAGAQLDGYFDRSVLRYGRWVTAYRYPFNTLRKSLNQGMPAVMQFSLTLEFGSEAGMAEVASNESAVTNEIRGALEGFSAVELLSAAGKMRLKEAIIAALNRRLLTARVRQVYLTDFRIVRLR